MHASISSFVDAAYRQAKKSGFYRASTATNASLVTGDQKAIQEVASKLALIHSEVSEALEDLRSCRITTRPHPLTGKPEGFATELADVVIRVFDLCGQLGIDLSQEIVNKMAYNATRETMHGKKI